MRIVAQRGDMGQVCKTKMAVLQLPKVKSSHPGCAAALSSILGSLLPQQQPPSSSKVQVISSASFLSAGHRFLQDLKIPFPSGPRNLSVLSVNTLIHLSHPERVPSPLPYPLSWSPSTDVSLLGTPPFLF